MARAVGDSFADSFSTDFRALFDLAYRVSYRILGDRDDANDVAAEALARAYARWSRLDDPAPWVATVAGRASIDLLRRRRTVRAYVAGARVPSPAPPADHRIQRLDLQRSLLALPRRQREVVVLRYLADRTEAETAHALGLSPGTVKSHASRGLAALRSTLGSDPETP